MYPLIVGFMQQDGSLKISKWIVVFDLVAALKDAFAYFDLAQAVCTLHIVHFILFIVFKLTSLNINRTVTEGRSRRMEGK
jgi:hypothetical protein